MLGLPFQPGVNGSALRLPRDPAGEAGIAVRASTYTPAINQSDDLVNLHQSWRINKTMPNSDHGGVPKGRPRANLTPYPPLKDDGGDERRA
jgi:hypothetical protein